MSPGESARAGPAARAPCEGRGSAPRWPPRQSARRTSSLCRRVLLPGYNRVNRKATAPRAPLRPAGASRGPGGQGQRHKSANRQTDSLRQTPQARLTLGMFCLNNRGGKASLPATSRARQRAALAEGRARLPGEGLRGASLPPTPLRHPRVLPGGQGRSLVWERDAGGDSSESLTGF